MIALVVALVVASADPVALMAGDAAPFDGVLVDDARAGSLVIAEADGAACRAQLAAEVQVRDAWRALAQDQASKPAPWETPTAAFWAGVGVGGVVVVGALAFSAWALGQAQTLAAGPTTQ